MSRLTALALLIAAPLASAQTTADVWPLAPGNTWTYVTTQTVSYPVGRRSDVVSAARWTALDSVETAAGRLPRLRIETTDAVSECLVKQDRTDDQYLFRFLDLQGAAPCASDSRLPRLIGGAPGVLVMSFSAGNPVVVGGQSLSDSDLVSRTGVDRNQFVIPRESASWQMVDGIGVVGYDRSEATENETTSIRAQLRQATVGGETFGQALETRTDFWPLAVGNRWEYQVTDQSGFQIGEVVWTIEVAGSIRLRRVENGAVAADVTCPISRAEASFQTSWQTRFSFSVCSPVDPALAPNLLGTVVPVDIDLFETERPFAIGAQRVVADAAVGGVSSTSAIPGAGVQSATYTLARDIGPVRYTTETGAGFPGNRRYDATLAFARIGSTTYGAQIVSGEDAPASAQALALSVGPNPVRASATLQFSLPVATEARIEILDALGRTVQRLDLGTRSAGANSARLNASGLAAGVYSVRLVAGASQTAARISVVR